MASYTFTHHETAQRLPMEARGLYRKLGENIADSAALHRSQYYGHWISSQATIRRSAEIALERSSSGNERAIVLGPGAASDTPLFFLTDNFPGGVTLVDVVTTRTAAALAALPKRLQSRVHLIKADLTGVAADVSINARWLAEAMPSYEEFIGPAASMLSYLDPHEAVPDLGTDYDFVSSHLVAGQLSLGLRLLTEQQTLINYHKKISLDRGGPDGLLTSALEDLGHQARDAHIDHLARLVSGSGTVHFADSYLISDKGALEPRALEPLPPQRFEQLAPMTTWKWPIDDERTFAVVAQVAALRGQNAL